MNTILSMYIMNMNRFMFFCFVLMYYVVCIDSFYEYGIPDTHFCAPQTRIIILEIWSKDTTDGR